MNRLAHIKQTLPTNLQQNRSPSIQFLILDYSSSDGLEQYLRGNFKDEVNEGSLVYYRYDGATSFNHSHSRNLAFRLASNDIVCNLDADNYAGQDFGRYVQNIFRKNENTCLTGLLNRFRGDASGKLVVSKRKFLAVNGYDEHFEGYGYEDFDLVNRLQLSGCDTFSINRDEYLLAIPHSNFDRHKNDPFSSKVMRIYIHYIDPASSILLFLFQDETFVTGVLSDQRAAASLVPAFAEVPRMAVTNPEHAVKDGWRTGKWTLVGDTLTLVGESFIEVATRQHTDQLEKFINDLHSYHKITDPRMKMEAYSFYKKSLNHARMMENLVNNRLVANDTFGKGVVFKNFSRQPIEL